MACCYYSIDCKKWNFKGVGVLLSYVDKNFLLLCYSVFIVVTLVCKRKTFSWVYNLIHLFTFLKRILFKFGSIDINLLLSSYDNFWSEFLSNLFSRVFNCHYVILNTRFCFFMVWVLVSSQNTSNNQLL